MKKEIRNGVILLSIGIIASISILMIKGNNLASVCITDYLNSKNVEYTNNNQSTVQGAIDNLYTKATTLNNELTTCQTKLSQKVTSDGAESVGFQTNTTKTVFANSSGICIVRNSKLSCFKVNNWNVEKTHIQNVFSDISCDVSSSDVRCYASDFICFVHSNGAVDCYDQSDRSECFVSSAGSLVCK